MLHGTWIFMCIAMQFVCDTDIISAQDLFFIFVLALVVMFAWLVPMLRVFSSDSFVENFWSIFVLDVFYFHFIYIYTRVCINTHWATQLSQCIFICAGRTCPQHTQWLGTCAARCWNVLLQMKISGYVCESSRMRGKFKFPYTERGKKSKKNICGDACI